MVTLEECVINNDNTKEAYNIGQFNHENDAYAYVLGLLKSNLILPPIGTRMKFNSVSNDWKVEIGDDKHYFMIKPDYKVKEFN